MERDDKEENTSEQVQCPGHLCCLGLQGVLINLDDALRVCVTSLLVKIVEKNSYF